MDKKLIFPLVLGGLGAILLVSLGIWQIQRLEWKTSILNRIETRIQEEPASLPEQPLESSHNFLPVRLAGIPTGDELFVLTSRRGYGPGYRLITGFETDGRRVLLDRGFIPDNARALPRARSELNIEGNLHWPDEHDELFTPEPDGSLWFSRDIERMSAVLGAESVMVVARNNPAGPSYLQPWPVSTVGIPNDHLQYAITWFSLAVVWLGMTAFWWQRAVRENSA